MCLSLIQIWLLSSSLKKKKHSSFDVVSVIEAHGCLQAGTHVPWHSTQLPVQPRNRHWGSKGDTAELVGEPSAPWLNFSSLKSSGRTCWSMELEGKEEKNKTIHRVWLRPWWSGVIRPVNSPSETGVEGLRRLSTSLSWGLRRIKKKKQKTQSHKQQAGFHLWKSQLFNHRGLQRNRDSDFTSE